MKTYPTYLMSFWNCFATNNTFTHKICSLNKICSMWSYVMLPSTIEGFRRLITMASIVNGNEGKGWSCTTESTFSILTCKNQIVPLTFKTPALACCVVLKLSLHNIITFPLLRVKATVDYYIREPPSTDLPC